MTGAKKIEGETVNTNKKIDFGVYLPQLAFSFEDVVARAQCADRLGYHSMWFLDHFYPPYMPGVGSFEAWTTICALAPLTERIRLGHLVLCNAFRHPALLAKMAASFDVISKGRLELGLGTGSVPREFGEFGIPLPSFAERTAQLEESIQIMKSMFSNEATTFDGKYYQVKDAPLLPKPLQKPWPPITIGGSGEKYTLPLVARHADVWNCPTYGAGELEKKIAIVHDECRHIGRDPATLRMSEQSVLVIVKDRSQLDAALAKARRHYGGKEYGLEEAGYIGTPADIIERIKERSALGISLMMFFFYDRADLKTLELFGNEVLPAFA